MKQIIAAVATLGLVGAALWFGRRPPPAESTPPATPAECIERMFAATERGDVEGYLDCFTGLQRDRLERELASQSREDFARSLRQSIQELKGRAVFDAPARDVASREINVTVERVYVHHLERQTYHFVNQSGAWRIDDVQSPHPIQPEKAYGQPVFELAPTIEESPGAAPVHK
jgi:hypothetical protein